MNTSNIAQLIQKDLETLLYYKSKKDKISVNNAIEIASYVAANFLRIIFAKNKEIKPEELNGVFGIISNIYNDIFQNQLQPADYEMISTKALELLNDTDFDQNCKAFFKSIIP
ncbi:hypothetical protein MG290_13215 [Flavobacterium sp. CBA20B-1]|uniref:Uncharacterized protein n=1 Tax=Paenimyroides aestuarii TaxID=2968490 RepID=A0ABY5NSY7_9FLAO|nr:MULTISPECIES: hypothetical protein [Flavobacteriaceae]UUV21648.1 hypothetical protein NPX36_00930 [Paenimyroides aestuarii]WCM41883.1 hypothetical protein MG290_13215 [Flavobacterium sp. CBA20B-1]